MSNNLNREMYVIQHKKEHDLYIHWDNERQQYIKYSKINGACIFDHDIALRLAEQYGKEDWQAIRHPLLTSGGPSKRQFVSSISDFLEISHYENH